ncbi:MAG: SPOR domain-containing protein [Magnetococcales bacterium]|nr:SPOR domain-containing protein [Magnetococcales bacterium]
MTGAVHDLDTSRQDPPTGTADIFISPNENNRLAKNSRRKRIGWHLTEALVAAVVGGIVTAMVWHPPASKAALEMKPELPANEASETTEAKNDKPAKFDSMDEFMGGKGDEKTAEAMAALTEKEEVKIEVEGPQLANKGKNDLLDDTLDLNMEEPADDSMDDAMSEPVEEMPLVSDETAAKPVVASATAHEAAQPAKRYLSMTKIDLNKGVATQPASTETPKAPTEARKMVPPPRPEAKALSLTRVEPKAAPAKAESKTPETRPELKTAPKSEARPQSKAAPILEAKPGDAGHGKTEFPHEQTDGQFLVTAGSFSNLAGAEKLQKQLNDAGIPVRLAKSTYQNKPMHHLLTGPFASSDLAGKAVTIIKERGGVEAKALSVPSAKQNALPGDATRTAAAPKPEVKAKPAEGKAPVEVKPQVQAKAAPVADKNAKSDATDKKPAVVAKAQPKAPAAAQAEPPQKTRFTGFVTTAASFSNPDNANAMRRRLTERGIKAFIKMAIVNGKEFSHVVMGPFATQKDADAALESVKKEIGMMAKATPAAR